MKRVSDSPHQAPGEHKASMQAHWGASPCGSNTADERLRGREYFDEIERHRYRTHPWLLEAIQGFNIAGKDVLEIGFGMGTDHLAMARRGGNMHGIDFTPRNLEVTRERFALYGQSSELRTGDAENLPYPDGSFDFVYSFGVIHHSPDTTRIVSEIRRVLRPGGRCFVAVYHRNSVFFFWAVFGVQYLLHGGWLRRTLEQQISLIEYPNTSEDLVVRLFRRDEFAAIFRDFRDVLCNVAHLIPMDIPYLSAFFKDPYRPVPFLDRVGRRFGWYIVAEATK